MDDILTIFSTWDYQSHQKKHLADTWNIPYIPDFNLHNKHKLKDLRASSSCYIHAAEAEWSHGIMQDALVVLIERQQNDVVHIKLEDIPYDLRESESSDDIHLGRKSKMEAYKVVVFRHLEMYPMVKPEEVTNVGTATAHLGRRRHKQKQSFRKEVWELVAHQIVVGDSVRKLRRGATTGLIPSSLSWQLQHQQDVV